MAYETGTAVTVDAILQKISTFASGLGWTVNRDVAITGGRELAIYHANAGYFNFESNNTIDDWSSGYPTDPKPWISIWGSTAYSAGSGMDAQTGSSTEARTNGLFPDFHTYHLFGTTSYIHCVIEIQPGLFSHLGCGKLEQSSTYTGGEYVYNTYWNHGTTYIYKPTGNLRCYGPFNSYSLSTTQHTSVRCDLEGVSPRWFRLRSTQSADRGIGSASSGELSSNTVVYNLFGSWYNHASPSSINGISPLMPAFVGVSTASSKRYLIGRVPAFRFTNIESLAPSTTITYGTDDWLVFPVKQKQLGAVTFPTYSSGIEAVAYLKVT